MARGAREGSLTYGVRMARGAREGSLTYSARSVLTLILECKDKAQNRTQS
jgi:hypothetical protein